MNHRPPRIPLPASWSRTVQTAMLHTIALARFAIIWTRGWAADSPNARLRLKAENQRLEQEVSLLREELRIKDVRMAAIPPHRRPHYGPTERLAILELQAARGWSKQQTADTFLLTAATIASWHARLDEEGPKALLQCRVPVNRFPDFARHSVQRLKTLCPSLGKVKIAQTLARAGLHLSATTVARILKEPPRPPAKKPATRRDDPKIVARHPDHVCHIDLSTVPIASGFWTTWCPHSSPQCWPFCWWVAAVVDHYSRRVVAVGTFAKKPDCRALCTFLGRAFRQRTPEYIICDRDSLFDCESFRQWARRKRIQPPRYGAVGRHGSIAVIERFFRTMKTECTRKVSVPMRRSEFQREISRYANWFNEHRPHATLNGRTPNEVYFGLKPANRRPRVEPRKRWPRRSRCAGPQTLVAGQPGDVFQLDVALQDDQRHLPVVTIRRAA